jgi:hypothetical protein
MPSLEPLKMIYTERQRQEYLKGHTPEKDDKYQDNQLVNAAICYAHGQRKSFWPWGYAHWKPSKDRLENLAKAGALILAEMERVMREREAQKLDPAYHPDNGVEVIEEDEEDDTF